VFYRDELTLRSVDISEELLAEHDCTVIVAGHTSYDYAWVVRHAPLIIYTVNATRGVSGGREKTVRIGAPTA
jgi:UDP-N-acetyl-D-glucosamine dehydrogenase